MKKFNDKRISAWALLLLFTSSLIFSAVADTKLSASKASLRDKSSKSDPTSPQTSIKTWKLVRNAADGSTESLTVKESDEDDGRYIIIDGGNTDTIGITEFFIYFGAVALAIVCALALLGILLAVLDGISANPAGGATTYGYGGTPTVQDTYSSYKRVFDVANALEQNYKQYADVLNPTI
ncbi:uncharacterized protein LOC108682620 [Hyalella azteca]|uniref:Uncharacterized protein LOC108682620 n=1 Tax=Hyalella azteca TaxID=294128 RepID=A0A8B7PPE8_HYAAZ|nr:uncharacterized protein LOC108682620 [Hyalella azteca]